MITYDGKKIGEIMRITLMEEPIKDEEGNVVDFQLRINIETENSLYSKGIDFDDGYPQAGEEIQEVVLGQVARFNWEHVLKSFYNN